MPLAQRYDFVAVLSEYERIDLFKEEVDQVVDTQATPGFSRLNNILANIKMVTK